MMEMREKASELQKEKRMLLIEKDGTHRTFYIRASPVGWYRRKQMLSRQARLAFVVWRPTHALTAVRVGC